LTSHLQIGVRLKPAISKSGARLTNWVRDWAIARIAMWGVADEADVGAEELLRTSGTGQALIKSFLSKCSFALSRLSFSFLRLSSVWCSYILQLDFMMRNRFF
jgi:hypothetical protein